MRNTMWLRTRMPALGGMIGLALAAILHNYWLASRAYVTEATAGVLLALVIVFSLGALAAFGFACRAMALAKGQGEGWLLLGLLGPAGLLIAAALPLRRPMVGQFLHARTPRGSRPGPRNGVRTQPRWKVS